MIPKGDDERDAKRDRGEKEDDSEEGEAQDDDKETAKEADKEADKEEPKPAKRSRIDRVQLDDKSKRGRSRLLGGLLTGTLNRVKKDFDKGPSKHEAAKAEVMERIREKERAQREKAREDRIQERQEQRQTELKERNRLARAQAEKEEAAKDYDQWDHGGGFPRPR